MSHAHTASSSSSNKNSAHTVTAMIKKFSKSIGAFRSSRLKEWSKGGFIKELALKIWKKGPKIKVVFILVFDYYLLAIYGIKRLVNEKSQSTTQWYPHWNLKINIDIVNTNQAKVNKYLLISSISTIRYLDSWVFQVCIMYHTDTWICQLFSIQILGWNND